MPELVVVRRNGDRHTILFDDTDAEVVGGHTWSVVQTSGPFYAITAVRRPDGGRTTLRMHRLLMGVPDVDHINGNGLDNRRANLRLATRSQQGANRRDRRGRSGYKGVSWSEQRQRWQTHIRVNRKSRYLGRFDSEIEAAKAYDKAAFEAWGEFALLNFPEEG